MATQGVVVETEGQVVSVLTAPPATALSAVAERNSAIQASSFHSSQASASALVESAASAASTASAAHVSTNVLPAGPTAPEVSTVGPATTGPPVAQESDISQPSDTQGATTTSATAPMSSLSLGSTSRDPSAHTSGLSSSAKIGIGLGIPLALLVMTVLGFLLFRYRHRLSSWRTQKASHPSPENHPASVTMGKNKTSQEEKGSLQEIHGTEVTAYSRELEGSPGVRRHELPTRRGSA